MKKTMLFKWFLSIVKLIGILAIPTLLCGFTVSFKAAFQTWLLLLAFLIPSIGGFLIIFNYVWKNQKLASFLRAVVIGLSFFTTSVVGLTSDVQGWREFLSVVDIIDSQASSWTQILSSSAIVGIIGFVAAAIGYPLLYSFFVRLGFETE